MGRPNKENYYLDIALAVSKRSTCLKRHYGCVIVKDDEIIATGYNGSPRGFGNCCDIHNENCPRADEPHNSGNYSNCPAVHAEQNAMLSASRKEMLGAIMYLAGEEYTDVNKDGFVDFIYKWKEIEDCTPCPICVRMIMNAGITNVINRTGELVLRELV